ncbi:MAG: electron transfer flavoprotein subunit alpha/FixB family protein [Bacteroidota bacterium]|nr:electron transfer flavoprotein subunit alpha/FixB family protein [Bacteroidota bacterium]
MSVLVYCEHSGGKFKKSTYEVVSYAAEIASKTNTSLTAISIGEVSNDDLQSLSKFGASKILQVGNDRLKQFVNMAYAAVIAEAAKAEGSKIIVLSASFTGKGLAPRIAVKLEAGLADSAIALPDTSAGFTVRKTAFSGKAYADVSITSDIKVLTLVPNSYKVVEKQVEAGIVPFESTVSDHAFTVMVKDIIRAADKILLPEAELVVSAGRGLKGPENWGMIEELASLLGAATACSKPVSDANWRPHSEHVGQTGISIKPNLYIAIGISGAIQHLAGVSASKTIVVINKDPEAPFFKAADYGIVGDAFEVVPKLIESIKKLKSVNA